MFETLPILFLMSAGMLLYFVVAYPILVRVLGRVFRIRKTTHAKNGLPFVTLIIPARNEALILEQKILNALESDYPAHRMEVLVVDDASTDRTPEIIRSFQDKGVQSFTLPDWKGKAAGINAAVQRAKGEIVCLTDANVLFRPDALNLLVGRLDVPTVGAVSGDVKLLSEESNFGRGESLYYTLERWLQFGESQIGSTLGVDGGMYIIRKELLKPLPPDTILDDFVISMNVIKQGYRVVYEPSAIATENGTPRANDEFRRRVRVAAGAVQSIKRGQFPPMRRPVELWQYCSHKVLRWLGPVWLVLLLVSNVMLWSQGLFYQVCLIGQAAFYAIAGLASVWVGFRRTRLGGISFYFTMSHVAMAIGVVKGLFWRQKGTWKRTERTLGSVTAEPLELTGKSQ